MSATLLELRDVHVDLGGTPILHGCEMSVRAGELVAVVGPNGAGKSTLARVAAGLIAARAGAVLLCNTPIASLRGRRRARMRAYVPQRPRVPDGVRVREAVELGRSPHVGMLSRPTAEDHGAVARALARTGATDLAERRLNTLSGGELQRVTLAIALAQEAPLLLADEPTAHLDLGAAATIARLLRSLADEGLAVVLVVHDLALAASISDRVVVVFGGRTVADGPAADVIDAPRLAEVWGIDAELGTSSGGRTALHVDWLSSVSTLERT